MAISIKSLFIYIFVSLLNVLVQCEIPNLNVRKMDQSLIAKKRQDTIDMCKLFTEENAKIQTKPKIIQSYKTYPKKHNRRYKRDVNVKYSVNPALNPDDAKRVESIVEKLYDDFLEKGEKITYRINTAIPTTTTTTMKPENETTTPNNRRFFFAPKLIRGTPALPETLAMNDSHIYDKARWTHGIIPYFIDSKTYDAGLQETIMKAFDYIEKATCIRLQKLRERPTDKRSLQDVDWVYITNPSGVRQCVHSNEKRKIDGVQVTAESQRNMKIWERVDVFYLKSSCTAKWTRLGMSVLGYDCMSLGDIVHEVMHILGFSHEHTRSDRDQYISINWDNIKPGYRKYFEISKLADQYTLENLPYDYTSVLHYPPRAFSKNGQLTIMTESGIKIGQRDGLSEIDLEKVSTIYSSECVDRNREYLLKTCPSVVKSKPKAENVTQKEIQDYFQDRLWPFGIVNYQLRDKMEFSTEEKENIRAVIRHIEKETCIRFKDFGADSDSDVSEQHNDVNEDSKIDNGNGIVTVDLRTPSQHLDDGTASQDPFKNISENEINHDETEKENILPEDITAQPELRSNSNTTKAATANVSTTRRGTDNIHKLTEESNPTVKPTRRQLRTNPKAARRHASSIMVLTRSALPGCKCPKSGKPKANTVLEINADCFNSVNDLLHLFVHVLGLDHQHNTYDRDSYLHIVWENLTPDIRNELMEKLPPAASVGFPYDYQSVMHYPWLQIKNGVTNMMYPIWNDGWAMGHWQGLSSYDVHKLNLLYFDQCVERQKHTESK